MSRPGTSKPPTAAQAAPLPMPSRREPARLAEAIAGLLKTCTVYPRTHPRVHDSAVECVRQVGLWVEAPRWFPLRVRGNALVLGDAVLENPSTLAQWMLGRFLENALAGLEFGPAFDDATAVELGFAFGSCSSRHGRMFAAQWPRAHASVRPLDLVFEGQHVDQGTTVVGGATQKDGKCGLLAQLAALPRVRGLLQSIEESCVRGVAGNATLTRMDVLAGIVDLLPAEVLLDAEGAAIAVERVLTEVEAGIVGVLHHEALAGDAEITRTALNVARKYFAHVSRSETLIVPSAKLASGRPEDEAITADIGLLVQEVARLPRQLDLRLPTTTAVATSPELAAELLGIYLQVLVHAERPETLRALAVCLPKALEHADQGRLQVLDCYLNPGGKDTAAALDDEQRLELLGFLERSRHGALVCERGYVDAGLLARTFPLSLPMLARLLDHEAGRAILTDGLHRVGPQRLLAGADLLRAKGLLAEPALLGAITAIGGELVLPLVRRLALVETPATKTVVVNYLRRQQLPQFESAALRHVEPASQLPGFYLENLARMMAERTLVEPRTRQVSGSLLRRYVSETMADLPLARQLLVIRALADVPGPETVTLVQKLLRAGGFLYLTSKARAIRRQAREVLRQLALETKSP